MAKFSLSLLAKRDLNAIPDYSEQTWGQSKGYDYIWDLDQGFRKLASDPTIGRQRDDLRVGLRSYHCNKHQIFFRHHESGHFSILRILHERMDHPSHL